MKKFFFLLFVFYSFQASASKLSGKVSNEKGEALSFASVYLKGTSFGTTCNVDGMYSLELEPGKYIVVAQYIGLGKKEISIEIKNDAIVQNFILSNGINAIKEVKIKSGENPAIRIIKATIKKRTYYNKLIDSFQAKAYIKGNIKLVDVNTSPLFYKMMAMNDKEKSSEELQKELEEQKGIIFLSESYTKVTYKKPKKLKIDILSTKVSGNNASYGFSQPLFINFYENNVSLGEQINPRGYISPIADGALLVYDYKFLRSYFDGNKEINEILVTPKRKLESTFNGIIHIIEDEWRLYSIDLKVDKNSQLDILDTIRVKQIIVPVDDIWIVKDQLISISLGLFGFKVHGDFIQIFTDYSFNYDSKKAFNKYTIEYNDDALKKEIPYWDSMRPVPLLEEELKDYVKKDSIAKVEKIKNDSLSKVVYKNTFLKIISKGYQKKINDSTKFFTSPILSLKSFNWNSVEGLNYKYDFNFRKIISKDIYFNNQLKLRYGFWNKHLNAKWNSNYSWGKTTKSNISFSLGKYIFQYDNANPVSELTNSIVTLFYSRNHLKFYEAYFAKIKFSKKYVNGFSFQTNLDYQDRNAIDNSTFFSFDKRTERFTENFPTRISTDFQTRHQSLISSLGITFQGGRRYVKYPDRVASIPSEQPVFGLSFTKGWQVFGSDINYEKWRFSINNDISLNMYGKFFYNISCGGFLRNQQSFIQDYTHFTGNQFFNASDYLTSFQMLPFYSKSNTERFYTQAHFEHHFYGLGTNKIPGFRKWKYYLVASSNAIFINSKNYYIEYALGLENLGFKQFRFFRLDALMSQSNFRTTIYGLRLGINSSFISFGDSNDD